MTARLQVVEYHRAIALEDVFRGHVNFARYFVFIGEAFAQWYVDMELSDEELPAAPLMAHLRLDLLGEMKYPGAVVCRLSVVRVGRSSLEHSIELFDAAHRDRLCGKGMSVNVWVDRKTGKTQSWPREVLERCWPPS